MASAASTPSPALLAANNRLLALRAQTQGTQFTPALTPTSRIPAAASATVEEATAIALSPATDWSTLVSQLPSHLGWGSQALSRLLRQQSQFVTETDESDRQPQTTSAPITEDAPQQPNLPAHGPDYNTGPDYNAGPDFADSVKLYPDIGLAMLRQEQTAGGRLWLLLRALDKSGRGWLRVANIRETLTKKNRKHYLCGWRQLRNLLRDGDDLYWQRDSERIWLRGAAKVAYGLGVERLSGRPVALPLAALLDGIGRFRAELYAAFHSSRVKVTPGGKEQSAPIARETLTQLSGVGETSQRRYEEQLKRKKTAVIIQPNFAIGQQTSQAEIEGKGWQQGNALFILNDYQGQQGTKGKAYVAWQLPNSYRGSHQQRPKGRQRRINRQLKDLVMKGMPGNESQTAEVDARRTRRYYPTGKLAAQAFNRRRTTRCYWRQSTTRNGRYAIWQHLEQRSDNRAGDSVR
jgi:hypothetical protein